MLKFLQSIVEFRPLFSGQGGKEIFAQFAVTLFVEPASGHARFGNPDKNFAAVALILNAFEAGVPVISSMGAAFRLDPTRVKVTRFDKVEGDGLAKALRMRFRKLERYPGKFECVWSDEPKVQSAGEGKGSVMQVTATFGMCLAAAAIKAVLNRA